MDKIDEILVIQYLQRKSLVRVHTDTLYRRNTMGKCTPIKLWFSKMWVVELKRSRQRSEDDPHYARFVAVAIPEVVNLGWSIKSIVLLQPTVE
jgi:hypothetical protein